MIPEKLICLCIDIALSGLARQYNDICYQCRPNSGSQNIFDGSRLAVTIRIMVILAVN